jgi:hypothetical protein
VHGLGQNRPERTRATHFPPGGNVASGRHIGRASRTDPASNNPRRPVVATVRKRWGVEIVPDPKEKPCAAKAQGCPTGKETAAEERPLPRDKYTRRSRFRSPYLALPKSAGISAARCRFRPGRSTDRRAIDYAIRRCRASQEHNRSRRSDGRRLGMQQIISPSAMVAMMSRINGRISKSLRRRLRLGCDPTCTEPLMMRGVSQTRQLADVGGDAPGFLARIAGN